MLEVTNLVLKTHNHLIFIYYYMLKATTLLLKTNYLHVQHVGYTFKLNTNKYKVDSTHFPLDS